MKQGEYNERSLGEGSSRDRGEGLSEGSGEGEHCWKRWIELSKSRSEMGRWWLGGKGGPDLAERGEECASSVMSSPAQTTERAEPALTTSWGALDSD
jgi:hypothetical protein